VAADEYSGLGGPEEGEGGASQKGGVCNSEKIAHAGEVSAAKNSSFFRARKGIERLPQEGEVFSKGNNRSPPSLKRIDSATKGKGAIGKI